MSFLSIPGRRFVLQAFFGVAILVILLVLVDFEALGEALLRAHVGWMGTGFLFFVSMVMLDASRTQWAFRHYQLGYETCLRIQGAGFFLSSFTPGMAGMEVLKVVVARRIRPGLVEPMTLALLLRLMGFITMLLILVLYVLCFPHRVGQVFDRLGWEVSSPTTTALAGSAAVGLICLSLLWLAWRFHGHSLRRILWDAVYAVRKLGTITLACLFVLSLLMAIAGGLSLFFLAVAVGADVWFPDMFVVLFLLTFGSLLPATPGGLGLREGAITAGFVAFETGVPEAVAIAFLHRACFWTVALAGGLILAFWPELKPTGHGASQ